MKRLFDFLFGNLPNEFTQEYFNLILTPVLSEAQIVFEDHLTTLRSLHRMIESEEPLPTVISSIEQGRILHLENRMRLRGALSTRLGTTHSLRSLFERGIWGLLRGGMATYEDGRIDLAPYSIGGRHTILDILYHIAGTDAVGCPDFSHYDSAACLDMIDHQIITIEKAFKDIQRGFEEYKTRAMRT